MAMVQVRLTSNGLINTPGVLAWAINGYAFKRDRPKLLKVLMDGYKLTKKCATDLLTQKVKFTVDKEEAVVFQYEEGQYLAV